MASIFKRKNDDGTSCWRVMIRIKGHPTICNHFDRKQEAEDWAQDAEHQIRVGKYDFGRNNQKKTFAELIDRYINDGALEHHKAATDTRRHLKRWLSRLGDYALVHITPELISEERKKMLETMTAKGKAPCNATVNRYVAALSSALSYAVRHLRWIEGNPCFHLIRLKESAGRDRILTAEESSRLLEECHQSHNPYLYCVVLIGITTGMRQGEILGLRWDQVDLQNQLAHLKETKSGRPRSVPLVDPVVEELRGLQEHRNPKKELVFASRTAFGRVDINKAWKEALKLALINNFRFHDLRHTFATLAARQGASNLELSTAMGHRTLQMLQRYTHLEAEVVRKYSDNIANSILEEPKT
jgi:integrase